MPVVEEKNLEKGENLEKVKDERRKRKIKRNFRVGPNATCRHANRVEKRYTIPAV
jgi:hypothetical protein